MKNNFTIVAQILKPRKVYFSGWSRIIRTFKFTVIISLWNMIILFLTIWLCQLGFIDICTYVIVWSWNFYLIFYIKKFFRFKINPEFQYESKVYNEFNKNR